MPGKTGCSIAGNISETSVEEVTIDTTALAVESIKYKPDFYNNGTFYFNNIANFLFGDGDHLNSSGKIVFSKYFVDYLKNTTDK